MLNQVPIIQMPTDLAGFDPGTIQTIPLSLMGIQCKDVDGEPVSCEATQPASPSYDNETGVCSSVLLEVSTYMYVASFSDVGMMLNGV